MKTYFINKENNYLPVVKATLHDPLYEKSVNIDLIVDTGFQGGVLIPLQTYINLNLNLFEEPKIVGKTAIGTTVELRVSKVLVEIDGTKIVCTAYTTLGVKKALLGREVLKELGLLYKPPKELKVGIDE